MPQQPFSVDYEEELREQVWRDIEALRRARTVGTKQHQDISKLKLEASMKVFDAYMTRGRIMARSRITLAPTSVKASEILLVRKASA
jgi:hypothetical protein